MYTTLHPSPVGDILLNADAEGRLTGLWLRHDVTEAGDGPFDAVREQLDAYQETKHVHIETKLEVKEWWYPYG